ncbi:3D domain-containing protein [Zeaxanthinibacter enoshimensis]|uniref:3D (Asp-Asp-Asp) domain-containing protein n=1 Tax=Zeaxanthinibacter enoshimensis TaxID=392009 RepID=A0A4R6TP70_9FLAO|nr:3D domain-containing protein [Zeaxanthinibacter enoshimensis]TDQ31405.1 3D (Asp-Asp-Asp) domain-containing protein [Zeaxanthinibacter enoshimensis]
MPITMKRIPTFLFLLLGASCARQETPPEYNWQTLEVKASAYNSVEWQTDEDGDIAAWGDTLKPTMRAIAVSRDLLRKGLDHNTPVFIEGLDGVFLVKDKMHHRWRNKIDIYMGKDIKRARKWGVQKVKISYPVKADTLNPKTTG